MQINKIRNENLEFATGNTEMQTIKRDYYAQLQWTTWKNGQILTKV